MSDEIGFNEGKDAIFAAGLTSTVQWALTTAAVGTGAGSDLTALTTYAGGFGEITGTGYARKVIVRPASVSGIVFFSQMLWNSGAAVDWPGSVSAAILIDSNNKLIYACNLQQGGVPISMSGTGAQTGITPTVFLQNVGGG